MSTTVHDPENADTSGQASQEANSQDQGAPISLDDATVTALLNHPTFQATIEDIATRKAKSQKDRRIAGLEKDVSDILSKLDLTPEQQNQVKEYQRDQLLEELQAAYLKNEPTGQSSNSQVANQAGGTTLDLIGAFTQAGYNSNSISLEDWEWAEAFKGDQVALANALVDRRLRGPGQTQGPEVSIAGVMPAGKTVSNPANGSQAHLKSQYDAEVAKVRRGDVGSLTALKAKYRKMGLDIF